jgi:RNA polymerase sigma-70 factor (ECF subfamily)
MDSNSGALHSFYKENAGKFKYLIFRYVGDKFIAEDLLQDGFVRIMSKISQYNGSGSFEGWAHRIIVNTALEYLRKQKKQLFLGADFIEAKKNSTNSENDAFANEIDVDNLHDKKIDMGIIYSANLSDEDLEEALDHLPMHYRIVFNLFAIDGYKHKEISKLLGINEKTSKSRLSKARKITQTYLYKKAVEKVKRLQYEK